MTILSFLILRKALLMLSSLLLSNEQVASSSINICGFLFLFYYKKELK